jgi:thiamine biosynthesis lipoprotein
MVVVACGSAACAWTVAACRSTAAEARHSYSRVAMGCEARIVLYARDADAATRAAEAAFARIEAVEAALSDWREDSEVARLQRAAGLGPQAAGADLRGCLERAVELARATDGAFDPTIGALTQAWRRARREQRAPTPEELEQARALVGLRHLVLHADGRIELATPGVRLDFGAIGKGWACDRALETLASHGIESALVEIGGDLACGAPPPGRAGWLVGAGNGADDEDARFVVAHRGVATSGDDHQGFVLDGRRRSHIVRPSDGEALVDTRRATVVARTGADADALATIVELLGPEAARELLARLQAEVHLQAP